MSEKLHKKLKTALDETRLLILGVQVLFGFQFQSFFQEGFDGLSYVSQVLSLAGLLLLSLSLGLLIAPSMHHRLVERGDVTLDLIRITTRHAALGLAPLVIGLALAVNVVVGRVFGMVAGIGLGILIGSTAGFFWYGFEAIIGLFEGGDTVQEEQTTLATKVDQLLTEARVIIPGAQALFGFQFVAMLTGGFDRLPDHAKMVHVMALTLVAINIILLMSPAALHRLSFGGEDSAEFLQLGCRFVIGAPIFLAAGISSEIYVVFLKVLGSEKLAVISAIASVVALIGLWYAIPLWLRPNRRARRVKGHPHERL